MIALARAYRAVLPYHVHSAVVYVTPNSRVKITKKFRSEPFEAAVTIGRPNARERKFVKACIKAGERFPIRKPQLVLYRAK